MYYIYCANTDDILQSYICFINAYRNPIQTEYYIKYLWKLHIVDTKNTNHPTGNM